MKGKTIVDTEKLQELLKLVRAFEDPLGEAERATESRQVSTISTSPLFKVLEMLGYFFACNLSIS